MNNDLKGLVDRPMLPSNQLLDRIVTELHPYFNQFEIDLLVDRMNILATSRLEANWSVGDCVTWLQIQLGAERYANAKQQWTEANQKRVSAFGIKKYRCNTTKQLYDGLDEGDDPSAYEIVYI